MDVRNLIDNSNITRMQIAVIAVCFILDVLDGFDVLAIAYTAPAIAGEWGLEPRALGPSLASASSVCV
jgi:hypothetical protein